MPDSNDVPAEKFGMSFAIVRSDIGGNIGRLAAAQAKDPARYSSVFPIITDEVQRGEQEGKQSDTNGLLWLKRCAHTCSTCKGCITPCCPAPKLPCQC